jgi:O-antigen ligase
MKIRFDKINTFFVIMLIFTGILFSFLIVKNLIIAEFIFSFLAIFFSTVFSQKVKLGYTNVLWILAILISMVSSFYAVDFKYSISQVNLFVFFLIMSTFISLNYMESNIIVDALWYASLFHIIFSMWQYIDFSSFYIFFNKFSDQATIDVNLKFYILGKRLCGITDQTGINAFEVSIFIMVNMIKLLCDKKNKIIKFVLLIIGLFVLFATGKRGASVFTVAICLIIWLVFQRGMNVKKKIKYIVLTSVLIFIVFYLNLAEPIINKIYKYQNAGDITNGRLDIWNESINIFKSHMIFGVGIKSIPKMLGNGTHNVYLELLAELGIFGAFIVYCALIYPFCKCVYLVVKEKITSKGLMVSFSIQAFFLMYCFTGNPLYDHKIMWVYAVAVGLVEGEVIKLEKNYWDTDIS